MFNTYRFYQTENSEAAEKITYRENKFIASS